MYVYYIAAAIRGPEARTPETRIKKMAGKTRHPWSKVILFYITHV